MNRYSRYSNSGLDWVGTIPSHWSFAKLKWKSKIFSGGTPSTNNPEYWEDGKIPWLASGEVNKKVIKQSGNYITKLGLRSSSAKWINEKSVIMALAGQGKTKATVAYLELKATCNQSLAAIIPNNDIHYKYLYYYLDSKYFQIRGLVGDSRDGLNLNHIGNIYIPIPSLKEQKEIVSYLNNRIDIIDNLIVAKYEFIKKLQKKRAATISHIITKGLNSDCRMKKSNVEWIGKIPEHWKITKIKYISNIVLGKMLTSSNSGSLHLKPYLRSKNVEWFHPNVRDVREMWFSSKELHTLRINKGDILVSEGGDFGRTCIWNNQLDECYIQNSVNKITLKHGNPKFLLYCMFTMHYSNYLDSIVNRVSIGHLTKEKLANIKIPEVDEYEQNEIVKFLDEECLKIDKLISTANSTIKKLKEYRNSLISSVVSGNIKVIGELDE